MGAFVVVIGHETDLDSETGAAAMLRTLGAEVKTLDLWEDASPLFEDKGAKARAVVVDIGERPDLAMSALRSVRKTEQLAETPAIVAISARQVSRMDPANGFDDFIVTPCTPVELYARIRQQEWKRSEFSTEERFKVAAARQATQEAAVALSAGDVAHARAALDDAEAKIDALLRSRKNHGFAALLGLITVGLIVGWKFIAHGRLKLVPGPLVAVVIATGLAFLLQLPVLYVQLPDSLADEIYLPRMAELFSLFEWQTWFFIGQLAIIASAETLLSASAVDRLHNGPRTDYDRELRAQGIGNMICGIFCALPMTGVIVRSSANVQAGAKTRLSTIMHGTWLLLFVVAFAWLLRSIPTSALAGILVFTGYKLMDLKAAKQLAKRGQSEIAIYLATFVTIVATDLLIGVLVGVVLSIAKLLYVFSKLEIDIEPQDESKHTIRLSGSATFLKVPVLAQALEDVPPHAELHVNVEHLDYIDAACLDLLDAWEAQHEKQGARLVIDSDSLEARFWRRKAGTLPHSLPVGVGDHAANGNGNSNGHGEMVGRRRRSPI